MLYPAPVTVKRGVVSGNSALNHHIFEIAQAE
jgi:hypothetical protein